MDKYKKKAVFSNLKKYDFIANEDDYIEVTEWKNGEGFDVDIVGKLSTRFQLTWGEYTALKKLVKKLESQHYLYTMLCFRFNEAQRTGISNRFNV